MAESSRIKQLEEEGDVAADYLEGLLDIADLDGDIDIDVEHGRASVSVFCEDSGNRYLQSLVGRDGEVLDAVQELTRLAVQTKTGERSRLMVDIANFRADLKKQLQEQGRDAIETMKREDLEAYEFEAMNPFERKVLHDVAADAGLHSESAGVEPDRYVVYTTAPASDEESVDSAEDTEEN
ncbi:single-stranded DNA-binding protein [Bowdeniella nasicola]|uniref:Single-stranded DNA-binding protein n=1 Tax=Bowdeniella nasicola TaxID=208480 RepID=A0A1Q5Q159_9ACTO|nr:R3H domain-containing nucleic acid-binding protein [Bowdeniella nasicola]OKL53320.1 single-stranded DNA-binding protein [Bowdeniella nasicola]